MPARAKAVKTSPYQPFIDALQKKQGELLERALFLGPAESAPQWDAVKALFEMPMLADIERRMVLSSRATDGLVEAGPVICACFGVGLSVIRDAIVSNRATNVEAIGKALRAGTNCGSCLPELKRIVHEHAQAV